MIAGYIREAGAGEFPDHYGDYEGFRVVIVDDLVDSDWRKADPPLSTGRCRWMEGRHACGQPVVAELNRRVRKSDGRRLDRWWGYCPEHLFGRTWVDGRLESTRLVREDDTP